MSVKTAGTTLSRRSFIGGCAAASTVAACAASTASVASADETAAAAEAFAPAWLGDEPDAPESFDAEYQCDVIVCGLGYAGVSATRAAVEAGASVVVFEKGDGFGLGSGDMCAFGSATFLERFPEIEPVWKNGAALLVNELSKNCLYRNKAALARKWVEINGEAVDWFVSAVPDESISIGTSENGNAVDSLSDCTLSACAWPYPANYDPYEENIPCLPGSYSLKGSLSKGFLSYNLDLAQAEAGDKLTVLRQTPAVKLVVEGGRVTGVIAKDIEGMWVKATATKGVVLATGDFINNEDMMKALLPTVLDGGYVPNGSMAYYRVLDAEGLNCDTGDGHRMAIWAGAKMQAYGCSMSHFGGGSNAGIFGTVPYLLLDLNGDRFMNEDVQGQQYAERIRECPQRTAVQVFDSEWVNQMDDMPYGHGKFSYRTQADVDKRLEAGTLFEADTLEGLLDNFDIDKEQALASIARYNELCELGEDLDYAKTAKRMFPVSNPPYYACALVRGDDLVTMSGIECNERCQALGEDDQVVEGLYVAGNVQGGRFASIYPEVALGVSVAMAMAFGREAGTNAATL